MSSQKEGTKTLQLPTSPKSPTSSSHSHGPSCSPARNRDSDPSSRNGTPIVSAKSTPLNLNRGSGPGEAISYKELTSSALMEELRRKDEQLASLSDTVNKLEQQVLDLTKQLKKEREDNAAAVQRLRIIDKQEAIKKAVDTFAAPKEEMKKSPSTGLLGFAKKDAVQSGGRVSTGRSSTGGVPAVSSSTLAEKEGVTSHNSIPSTSSAPSLTSFLKPKDKSRSSSALRDKERDALKQPQQQQQQADEEDTPKKGSQVKRNRTDEPGQLSGTGISRTTSVGSGMSTASSATSLAHLSYAFFGGDVTDKAPPPSLVAALEFISEDNRLNVLADGCTAAEISNVRMMFSTGEIAENADGFSKLGPRVVASLIHQFLLELPEPIISGTILRDLLDAFGIDDSAIRVCVYHSLIYKNMDGGRRTLLLDLLVKLHEATVRTSVPVRILAPRFSTALSHLPAATPEGKEMSRFLEQFLSQDALSFSTFDKELQFDDETGFLKAISLNNLVLKICDSNFEEPDFLDVVLGLHKYFCNSVELLQKLLALLNSMKGGIAPWQHDIRITILEVLQLWLKQHSVTIHAERQAFLSELAANLDQNISTDSRYQDELVILRKHMKNAKEATAPETSPPRSPHSWTALLTDCALPQLAAQLTLIDHKMFKAIPETELLFQNYKERATSPRFHAMVDRFNEIGSWIATQILRSREAAERANVIAATVELAKECESIGNFNTAYAIFCGLNLPPISRLKDTWAKLPKKSTHRFDKLYKLFNVKRNFQAYRSALQEFRGPVVPILSLYPRFINFVEETQKNTISLTLEKTGKRVELIHMTKLRLLWKIIAEIRQYQASKFKIVSDEELAGQLSNLKPMNESEQYVASLSLEPRRETDTGKK